jgi:hypothetical protein
METQQSEGLGKFLCTLEGRELKNGINVGYATRIIRIRIIDDLML